MAHHLLSPEAVDVPYTSSELASNACCAHTLYNICITSPEAIRAQCISVSRPLPKAFQLLTKAIILPDFHFRYRTRRSYTSHDGTITWTRLILEVVLSTS